MIIKSRYVKQLIRQVEAGRVTNLIATKKGEKPKSYLCVLHPDDVDYINVVLKTAKIEVSFVPVTQCSFKVS